MTDLWAYKGSYRGHVWDDPIEELRFARSDLEHAYLGLLNTESKIISVCEAKIEMDRAVDRVVNAMNRMMVKEGT